MTAPSAEQPPPRVFLSYSHDSDAHRERVLKLAYTLREQGIDAWLDRFEPHPDEGWPLWMERQIEKADFVVIVCSATYKRRFDGDEAPGRGLGAAWEAELVRAALYSSRRVNRRFIPVFFSDGSPDHLPRALDGYTWYQLPDGYDGLYRQITDQPEVHVPALGERRDLPPAFHPGGKLAIPAVRDGAAPKVAAPTPQVGDLGPEGGPPPDRPDRLPPRPGAPAAPGLADRAVPGGTANRTDTLLHQLKDHPVVAVLVVGGVVLAFVLALANSSLDLWTKVFGDEDGTTDTAPQDDVTPPTTDASPAAAENDDSALASDDDDSSSPNAGSDNTAGADDDDAGTDDDDAGTGETRCQKEKRLCADFLHAWRTPCADLPQAFTDECSAERDQVQGADCRWARTCQPPR